MSGASHLRRLAETPYNNPAVLRYSRDMGDKSPKMKNKQAAQKQAKANSANKQKNDNKAAKQTVKPKR
jgi:hypothetical protein